MLTKCWIFMGSQLQINTVISSCLLQHKLKKVKKSFILLRIWKIETLELEQCQLNMFSL